MIKLSFPTIKLGKYIKEVKCKVKNTDLKQDDLIVYGVTNTDGITVTNNKASDDLSNYIVLNENQFAYNPYRVNVGSIGLSTAGTFGVVSPAYVVFEATEEISSEFLLYYLKSDLGINLIKWYGDRGGVRSALRFADLKEIDFPDIDFEKQLSILGKMKEIDSKLCEFNENLSLENISSLRQAILQQAAEGKLCEQDLTDEAASVLLEKIKAEKEKLIAEKKIKKQKELPPITEEEKPFDLPKGWVWCRLGEIVEFLGGFAYKSDRYIKNSSNLIIRLGNVKNDKLLFNANPVYIDDNYAEETKTYKLSANDIVVTMTGTRGKRDYFFTHKILESDLINYQLFLNQRVGCLRSYNCANVNYIVKALKSTLVLDQIFATETGTANQGNIGSNDIMKILFPLPPLAEQQRIAEKVDKLMALCDELEQEITSAKKYAAQLMEAVLQEAFSNKSEETNNNVIVFAPQPQQVNTHKPILAAAARGKMSEATWKRIADEAVKLASEES